MIVVLRIDDRLIHGQVVEGWLNCLRINHIVVCNNDVANDEVQKTFLRMAVPENIKLSVFSIDEGAEKLNSPTFKNDRIMVLLSSPADVLKLIEKGFIPPKVNVGCIQYYPGKKQIHQAVSVGPQEIKCFQELCEKGINVEIKLLPTDKGIDIKNLLKNE